MEINKENLWQWHERYLSGQLSDAERAAYEKWIDEHPEARREQKEWAALLAAIEQAGHQSMKQEILLEADRLRNRTWPMLTWYRVAAILFFILLLPAILIYSPYMHPTDDQIAEVPGETMPPAPDLGSENIDEETWPSQSDIEELSEMPQNIDQSAASGSARKMETTTAGKSALTVPPSPPVKSRSLRQAPPSDTSNNTEPGIERPDASLTIRSAAPGNSAMNVISDFESTMSVESGLPRPMEENHPPKRARSLLRPWNEEKNFPVGRSVFTVHFNPVKKGATDSLKYTIERIGADSLRLRLDLNGPLFLFKNKLRLHAVKDSLFLIFNEGYTFVLDKTQPQGWAIKKPRSH